MLKQFDVRMTSSAVVETHVLIEAETSKEAHEQATIQAESGDVVWEYAGCDGDLYVEDVDELLIRRLPTPPLTPGGAREEVGVAIERLRDAVHNATLDYVAVLVNDGLEGAPDSSTGRHAGLKEAKDIIDGIPRYA